jgi:hypothetical protein
VPTSDLFTTLVGNDCAGGLLWGIAACVPTFEPTSDGYGRKSPNMVPVGSYDLPDYSVEKSSMKICEMNGAQKLYESYALLLPADILVSTGNPGDAGHLMMVVEEPKIVRNADGTIDGKQSTVAIQDQRGGARQNTSEYVKSENGESRHYSGRTYAPLTFESLFNTYYLPYSCLEFAGEREYIMPNVSTDIEISSLEDLASATLKSQYLLCVFYVRAYNQAGESVYDRSILTTYEEMKAGKLKNFPLSDLKLSKTALSRNVKERGELTFVITCLDATGTEHEFARFNATV